MHSRRHFLLTLAGGTAGLTLVACGAFPAESGVAYEPWDYPEADDDPTLSAVHAATLAASPHNTQPWSFLIDRRSTSHVVDVFADSSRTLGAMDGLRRELWLGLGCAIENLVVAASHLGRDVAVTYLPSQADPDHAARLVLTPAPARPTPLFSAIARRHTNRAAYLEGAPLPGLEAAVAPHLNEPDVTLVWLTSGADRARFASATISATEAIVDDAEMLAASDAWYRHTKDEIDAHRDGVTLDATGNGATIIALGKSMSRPSVESAGQYWVDGTRDRQTSASAFGILSTTDRIDLRQQLACGRTYQRLHLWATTQNLAMQPLNQLPERQDREQVLGLPPRLTTELRDLSGSATVQLCFRIGVPWESAKQSPRRPVAWVLR